jgi:prepilin-type N-terminal cleavage/methylation domain-containing protein
MIMRTQRSAAFTLVELLVVIAIIGILIALLLPAIQAAREAARRTQCTNNLKQLSLALQNFHTAHNVVPCARWGGGTPSWMALLMPYIEEANAYDLWHFDKPYRDPLNKQAREVSVNVFNCPTRRAPGSLSSDNFINAPTINPPGAVADYAACNGDRSPGSQYDPNAKGVIISSVGWGKASWSSNVSFKRVTDGLSKTFFCGEKHLVDGEFGYRYGDQSIYNGGEVQAYMRVAGPGYRLSTGAGDGKPQFDTYLLSSGGNQDYQALWPWLFGSWHPGVCQFAMCDGSVHSVSNDTDVEILRRLAVRDDGDVISENVLQ